ncbi:MAG: LptF/LptG family permease [Pyrinomonadaceae bacterium]
MKKITWLISKYLISTIIPFFIFSWLLLSVILFVQQANRFSDIFFSVNIPANLVWQLSVALIPSVIAFTCPMAMLVGTIIGLTKMQGDSELVAIRAAGVGGLQMTLPIAMLGVIFSIFAFIVNLFGVPLAARLVRSIALQSAIKKLESPIEPGVFNSEVAGYTIYVKGGDFETGSWKNIFIHYEDKTTGVVRLITSQKGRIDTADQISELVLEDATVTTIPMMARAGKYVSENIGEVRLGVKTRRADLIEKLSRSELSPEELGLQQLSDYAASRKGSERIEAEILRQRRIILSVTPFIFCILGTVIVLRFKRAGRGFGILLALVVLLGFYLLAFLGEQLARVGIVGVFLSSLIPVAGSVLALLWFSFSQKMYFAGRVSNSLGPIWKNISVTSEKIYLKNQFLDITTGIRDFDLVTTLVKNFVLIIGFLASIFIIFTGFELWKHAAVTEGGAILLFRYLYYLFPFVYLQISPSAAMIATLATYVIKSRQNEIVTWTSAGQSIYRLLLPCLLLALFLGGLDWVIQERVLPRSNQRQDEIRSVMRNHGLPLDSAGKHWIANESRIYSFQVASDNENRDPPCSAVCLKNFSAYLFDLTGTRLQSMYRSEWATWQAGKIMLWDDVKTDELIGGQIVSSTRESFEFAEDSSPFDELRTKPTHLTSGELRRRIATAESEVERRNLSFAFEKKHTTFFLPFVMALFTAPFSLSLSRKGKAATVGYAVGLWLLFTGTSSLCDQLGLNGSLPPTLAVWSPLVMFSLIGVYLLSKIRT